MFVAGPSTKCPIELCMVISTCSLGGLWNQANWDDVANFPLLVSSRDFAAVKLQWEAKTAAVRKDAAAARAAAAKLVSLSQEPGQDPFVKLIISLQAEETEGFAAEAAGDSDTAVARLEEAVALEDSIERPVAAAVPGNSGKRTLWKSPAGTQPAH